MKSLISILVFASLALTACGKGGFNSADSKAVTGGSNDSQGGGDDGGSTGGETPATWDKVDMNGYPSGGSSAGKLVVFINKEQQSLLLVLPVPLIIPFFTDVQIPDLEGAYLTNYTDSNGGKSLAVNLPLKHLIKGGAFAPHQNLPSGDPLPFVPSGELPGFAIDFPQMTNYRIHVYVGTNVAAAFVELPDLGLPIGGIFPVKNATKTKIIGAFGYVLPKGSYKGGLYLAAQIPDEMAAVIDDLIRW